MKQEWRAQAAKLARAYMRGGQTPYAAAKRTGFARVSLMEQAIDELERVEGGKPRAGKKPPMRYGPRMERKAMGSAEARTQSADRVIEGEYYDLLVFEASGDMTPMVRVVRKHGRQVYANYASDKVPGVIELLQRYACEVGLTEPNRADALVRENDELGEALAAAREQLVQLREAYKELECENALLRREGYLA